MKHRRPQIFNTGTQSPRNAYSFTNGFGALICASIAMAGAGVFYSLAFKSDRNLSPYFVATIRIIFAFGPIFFLLTTNQLKHCSLQHWRDTNLLLWGVFGSLTLATYFLSVPLAGVGITQFLGSIQGFVLLLTLWPSLAKSQKKIRFLSVFISMGGLFLLLIARNRDLAFNLSSWVPGIASGVFAGLAYTHLGPASKRHNPAIVSLFWGIPSLLTLALLTKMSNEDVFKWTQLSSQTFLYVLTGGALTALGQLFFSKAARGIDLVVATLFMYLVSVVNLLFDVTTGAISLSSTETFGILIIIFGSAILPLWKRYKLPLPR